MDTETVRCEVKDHIALVTLDRPPVNAMNAQLQRDVMKVFDALGDMPDVRVAVLTGQGKVFCAGADIRARAERSGAPGEGGRHNRRARESFHAIVECAVPVVAAVNGAALGAGLALVASADILIASEKAVLGLPEIDVGMLGGGRHAMRLFGHSRTRRMMFTGMRMDGPELYRLGVVEDCVAPDKLMDRAMEIAGEIASKSPVAMKLAKQALNAIEFMSLRDGYRFEQNMTAELSKYDDSREAMAAFLEKRPPEFKGR